MSLPFPWSDRGEVPTQASAWDTYRRGLITAAAEMVRMEREARAQRVRRHWAMVHASEAKKRRSRTAERV